MPGHAALKSPFRAAQASTAFFRRERALGSERGMTAPDQSRRFSDVSKSLLHFSTSDITARMKDRCELMGINKYSETGTQANASGRWGGDSAVGAAVGLLHLAPMYRLLRQRGALMR
jgi:hypothetical protein